MALFTHRKSKARGDLDDAAEEPPLQLPQTIGSILRARRLQAGKTIADAAAALRIRAAFLTAIEEDDLDRLPGPVYAVGFVRTYAEYLGLDGEKVARRFKQDVAGLEARQDFSFPVALPERSRPGGAILLVALIVGACAYGLWYYRAAGGHEHPDRVAAVPADLMPPQPIAAPKPAAAAAPATPATASAAIPGSAATAGAQPAVVATAAPPLAPPAAAAAPASLAAAPPVPPAPSVAAPEKAKPAAVESAKAEPPAAVPASAAPAAAEAQAAPPPPAPDATRVAAIPAVPAAAPQAEAPRVYGVTNGPVRIVLRAAAGDSWIEVKDGNQTIAMRVLRKGESYRVPDRKGLILVTGSAGALDITVDGHPAPSVGPLGKKRIVALDPEKLAKGAATLD